MREAIEAFLSQSSFAVAGASTDRSKYGNRVLRHYRAAGRQAYALNPKATEIEGEPAYPDLAALPEMPAALSIVTPPAVTERVVDEALQLGIRHIWMQPGAESQVAIDRAIEAGVEVIHGGACVLVEL